MYDPDRDMLEFKRNGRYTYFDLRKFKPLASLGSQALAVGEELSEHMGAPSTAELDRVRRTYEGLRGTMPEPERTNKARAAFGLGVIPLPSDWAEDNVNDGEPYITRRLREMTDGMVNSDKREEFKRLVVEALGNTPKMLEVLDPQDRFFKHDEDIPPDKYRLFMRSWHTPSMLTSCDVDSVLFNERTEQVASMFVNIIRRGLKEHSLT